MMWILFAMGSWVHISRQLLSGFQGFLIQSRISRSFVSKVFLQPQTYNCISNKPPTRCMVHFSQRHCLAGVGRHCSPSGNELIRRYYQGVVNSSNPKPCCFIELTEAANTVISFYSTSLGLCVGPGFKPPSLEFLGLHWFEAPSKIFSAQHS